MDEGATGTYAALETGKGKEEGSLLESPEGARLCQHSNCSPVKLISDPGLHAVR